MVSKLINIGVVAGLMLFISSCDSSNPAAKGPIVLGDSSAIVTEADQQQLKDMVTDLQPVIPPAENKDEEQKPAADTPKTTAKPEPDKKPAEQKAQPLPNTPGLRAEFKEVTVQIGGLGVKQAGNRDLQRANGAVYTLTSGNIAGATIRVSGSVTKISQRYQTISVMKSNAGDLPLEALSVTTRWENVNGGPNGYKITGLDAPSLQYYDADAEDIRDAVQRAARRRRMPRHKVQALVNSVRHLRAANQKPLVVVLRSVMWKIDGKDAQGRNFSKQIRVDIPL